MTYVENITEDIKKSMSQLMLADVTPHDTEETLKNLLETIQELKKVVENGEHKVKGFIKSGKWKKK